MQKTVQSLESETKEELNDIQATSPQKECRFSMAKLADKPYTPKGAELSLSYGNLYGDTFSALNELLLFPTKSGKDELQPIYDKIERDIESLIEKVADSGRDTQSLQHIRDSLLQFTEGQTDEFTLIITIHGDTSSISCLNKYFEDGIVKIDLSGNPTHAEEAALRNYESQLVDAFNAYTPNQHRPTERFKRELTISFLREDNEVYSTIDVNTRRMKYSTLEKVFRAVGLSGPYKEEPILEL